MSSSDEEDVEPPRPAPIDVLARISMTDNVRTQKDAFVPNPYIDWITHTQGKEIKLMFKIFSKIILGPDFFQISVLMAIYFDRSGYVWRTFVLIKTFCWL